ncbi:MAG: hypothetical protein J6O00_00020 [Clostridiales bacterium]|nr:hypothetical protein [Clostridiales bacterium]
MRKIIMVVIILIGMIGSISDYVFSKHDAYNRYLEGEYYFIYEGTSFVPGDPNRIITPDDPMFYADYSDPRNMLMISSLDIEVYNYHDGFCTVLYGENVIEEFPAARVRISDEDTPYFYGTKQYTYEEFISKLDSFSRKEISRTRQVSDKHMFDYRKILPYTIIITGADILILAIAFFFRNSGEEFIINIMLFAGAGLNILFNIITWFVY